MRCIGPATFAITALASCTAPAVAEDFRVEFVNEESKPEAAVLIEGGRAALARAGVDGIVWLDGAEVLANDAYFMQLTADLIITFDLNRCLMGQSWETRSLDGRVVEAQCFAQEEVASQLPTKLELESEMGFVVELSGSTPELTSYWTVFNSSGGIVGLFFLPNHPPVVEGAEGAWLVHGDDAASASEIIRALRP